MAQPPAGDYPIGDDGLPDLPLRVLEDDENIPPRPEEELADLERTDEGGAANQQAGEH